MDDTLSSGSWSLDVTTRRALRIERIQAVIRAGAFQEAVLEAEELLDEAPDDAEALVLLGDVSIETGDLEVAVLAFEHHLMLVGGEAPRSLLGLAVAHFELCNVVRSLEASREAIRLQSDLAEAHHYAGLAHECLGRPEDARDAFATARRIAPEHFPVPISLEPAHWQEVIASSSRLLEPGLQHFWNDLPIRLLPLPDLEELQRSDPPISPRIAGLVIGEPPEGVDPATVRPGGLRLYTNTLSRLGSVDSIVKQVAETLHSEALAWLGLMMEDTPE